MTELSNCKKSYNLDGNDPDPLTLILTWLGAVGSVASVVSWYEQSREVREERWQRELNDRARYQCIQKTFEIESDMVQLDAQIGKIDVLLTFAESLTVNNQPMMIPPSLNKAQLRFGAVRLVLTDELIREFARFHKETATINKRLGVNVISLIQELSQYRIYVDPEASHRLFEFRLRLNQILESRDYVNAISRCKEAIVLGREAMSALKNQLQQESQR